MNYTVNQLAQLAGISVRTLHYYDQIGLLEPNFIADNGYRYYSEKELIRLQQILFFRELEFSLQDIKSILNRSDFNVVDALEEQKKLIQLQRARMTKLIKTIDKTITTMNNNEKIEDEELYDAFKDDDVKQYQQEVKERWGNTDAYKQSIARTKNMTKQEMEELKERGKALTQQLADSMDKTIEDAAVQKLIQQHYDGINFFYDCSLEMYRNLGNMYVEDTRFTAYYDNFRSGLAIFVRDAIAYYCDTHEKKA